MAVRGVRGKIRQAKADPSPNLNHCVQPHPRSPELRVPMSRSRSRSSKSMKKSVFEIIAVYKIVNIFSVSKGAAPTFAQVKLSYKHRLAQNVQSNKKGFQWSKISSLGQVLHLSCDLDNVLTPQTLNKQQ